MNKIASLFFRPLVLDIVGKMKSSPTEWEKGRFSTEMKHRSGISVISYGYFHTYIGEPIRLNLNIFEGILLCLAFNNLKYYMLDNIMDNE